MMPLVVFTGQLGDDGFLNGQLKKTRDGGDSGRVKCMFQNGRLFPQNLKSMIGAVFDE